MGLDIDWHRTDPGLAPPGFILPPLRGYYKDSPVYYLLPTVYCLLSTAYCLLPTTYHLLFLSSQSSDFNHTCQRSRPRRVSTWQGVAPSWNRLRTLSLNRRT